MPAMSDANASQTRPCPGSFLAMSSVYSLTSRQLDGQPRLLGLRRSRRSRGAATGRFSTIGEPSGFVPIARYGWMRTMPVPSLILVRSNCNPMSRPGTDRIPYGRPSTASVSGTAASHSGRPAASRTTRCGAGPEAVLVERVTADRQRIVDSNGLASDLDAVLVHRQVRREVARLPGRQPGRIEAKVLDQQQSGRPDGLDGQRLAFWAPRAPAPHRVVR